MQERNEKPDGNFNNLSASFNNFLKFSLSNEVNERIFKRNNQSLSINQPLDNAYNNIIVLINDL